MFNCLKNKQLLICSFLGCLSLASMNSTYAQFGVDAGAVLNQFLQQQRYEQFDHSLINPGLKQSEEPVITIEKTRAEIVTPEDTAALNDVKKAFDESNFESVVAIANQQLQRNPSLTELILYRGAANYYLGNYSVALEDAKTYLILDPENTKALLISSAANLMLKDYKNSISDCENVLKQEKNEKAYVVCGFNYAITDQKISKALKYANNALSIDPNSEGALLVKGIAFLDQGKAQQAIDESNKVIALNPVNPYAYTVRGFALFKEQNYDKAKQDATIGIKYAPENPYNYMLMGQIYQQNNDKISSLDEFKKAKALFYKNGDLTKAKELEQQINKLYTN